MSAWGLLLPVAPTRTWFSAGALLGGHVALADSGPYRFQLHLGGGRVGHRGRRCGL